ncbi:MAG TPA: hypothetical protein DEG96_05475 [Candidatus Atribacteria bacterium]|nr:hypothetical protein [Candidatus Atribacteria bacterium]
MNIGVLNTFCQRTATNFVYAVYFSKYNFLCENLVFRGGTALKKIYFPEFRFSEDLDFVVDNEKEINVY